MAKRLLKIAAVLAAVVVVVLAALAVAVKIFLPPEKVRGLLIAQLQSRLHREVKLGNISIGLFRGLRVDDFAISEPSTFSAGTFVQSQSLVVKVALSPLLAKKIVVTDFRLVSPAVRVVRFPDGRFNFSDLTGEAAPAAPASAAAGSAATAAPASGAPATTTASSPASGGASGYAVVVTRASIEKGTISFDDRSGTPRTVTLRPVDLSLGHLTLSGSADVKAAIGLEMKGLKATLEAQGRMDGLKGNASIEKLKIASGPSSLTLSGRADHIRSDPALALKLSIDRFDPSILRAIAPLPVAIAGPISGSASVDGPLSAVSASGQFDLTATRIASPGAFDKRAGVPLKLTFNAKRSGPALLLPSAGVQLAGLSASVSGRIDDVASGTPSVHVDVKTNPFPVADVMALLPPNTLPADVNLSGPVTIEAKVDGTAQSGRLTFGLGADGARVAYGTSFEKAAGTPMSVAGAGRYRLPMALDVESLDLRLASARFTGPASFKTSPTTYTANLKAAPFDIAGVAACLPSVKEYRLAGSLSIDAAVHSAAAGPEVKGDAQLKGLGARYNATEITALQGPVRFTQNSVAAPALKGRWNGWPLQIALMANNVQTHPVVDADVVVDEIDLAKLLPPETAAPKAAPHAQQGWLRADWVPEAEAAAPPAPAMLMDVSGSLKAERVTHPYIKASNTDITYKLKNVSANLDKMQGTATFRQGAGEFQNIQKLTQSSKAAKILLMPLTVLQKLSKATGGKVALPSADHATFKSMSGDYTFTPGVMAIKSFRMDSSVFDATMSGTVGLVGDMALNVKSALLVPSNLLGGSVGALLADENGRVSLGANVGGTVAEPKVSVDLSAIKKNGAKLLENVLGIGARSPGGSHAAPSPSNGGASGTTPPTATPAPNPQDELKKDAQQLLKGLFKRR